MISTFCVVVFIFLMLLAYHSTRLLWESKDRYNKKYNKYWDRKNREDRPGSIIERVYLGVRGLF